MNPVTAKCSNCGANLIPDTNFCRQCGTAISGADGSSELPTTRFPQQQVAGSTQQYDARPTSPNAGLDLSSTAPTGVTATSDAPKSRRVYPMALLAVAVLIILVCSVVAIVRMNSHNRTTASTELIYPGSQTVLDMTSQEGDRAIQLVTTDSLEQVESWYQKNLKPTKTVKLASTSVVLRNENTMATIASEGGKTSILLKISD